MGADVGQGQWPSDHGQLTESGYRTATALMLDTLFRDSYVTR